MIPADHITFNNDGTAWWVPDDTLLFGPPTLRGLHLDRPCDTCEGTGAAEPDEELDDINLAWLNDDTADLYDCPDCINERHTFEIEVETDTDWDVIYNAPPTTRIHRVSIVPGMILPLLDGDVVHEVYPPNGIYWSENQGWWLDSDWENIIDPFPPAAAPGMYAVQLRVTT